MEGSKGVTLALAASASAFFAARGAVNTFVAAPAATSHLRCGPVAAGRDAEAKASCASAGASSPLVGLGCVAAACATGVAARRRSIKAATATCAFENELGVQAPVGFWDPAGFTSDGDAYEFRRRRVVEIKHGRVSMLACIGYIVPEFFKWPGYLSVNNGIKFADIPNGLSALKVVPALGWAQYVGFCFQMELFAAYQDDKEEPGKLSSRLVVGTTDVKTVFNQYYFGTYGIPNGPKQTDPEIRKKKLAAELANGRLAMVAIIGMFFQDGLTGSAWGDWALYTASPLRAGPKILEGTGGPFADSFWDPIGLAKGKSDEQLLRWRAVELKHGRVSMLACLGWFHVAAGWHPIGDAAAGARVSDDPLVNMTQLSMGGAWQLVFSLMCVEWVTTYVCKPPKEAPWDLVGWTPLIADPDAQSWKDSQLRELNNGRLAMVGFFGLVAGDLTTGDYVAGIGKSCGGLCEAVIPGIPPIMIPGPMA